VTVALIVFCGATIAAMWLTLPGPGVQVAVLLLAVAGAAALIGLQGNNAAFLGVFPALCVAAFGLPVRLSAVVAGAAIAAVSAAWVANGRAGIAGIVLNDFAILAFYVLSLFARRLGESNQRAELLLSELEQTRAAQAQAAALAERQRLAREMHDVLAHSLSGLVLNLEGAMLLASQGDADPQVGDAIRRAHRLAKTGLQEARRAIGMLRDDALPGPQRLADLAAEFEADTGVACQVTVTGTEAELGADARLTLYRAAQEALTNIRKHARPSRAEIRLAYEPSGARLIIEDFGRCGAHPAGDEGTGYGLTGMRERAELVGGTLTAGPTDGGFRVELRVPA
jgi:signal transduction histidine kinase